MNQEIEIKSMVGKPNRDRKLNRAFGKDKNGLAVLPLKVSNVKVSRISNSEERGGCTRCYPHGIDTTNATANKNKRSWKSQRKTRWI